MTATTDSATVTPESITSLTDAQVDTIAATWRRIKDTSDYYAARAAALSHLPENARTAHVAALSRRLDAALDTRFGPHDTLRYPVESAVCWFVLSEGAPGLTDTQRALLRAPWEAARKREGAGWGISQVLRLVLRSRA